MRLRNSVTVRIYCDDLLTRVLGSLTGAGFIAIGLYAMFGAGPEVETAVRERAFWFGATATFIGVLAVGFSWLARDLSGIWCRPPRRWW